jgi:hypothetical protein
VRLHEALTRAGVHNRLITLKGYGHGHKGFTDEIRQMIAEETIQFLQKLRILEQE